MGKITKALILVMLSLFSKKFSAIQNFPIIDKRDKKYEPTPSNEIINSM